MENILTLATIVADTVKSYVTDSLNAKLLYTEDASSGTYSVLVVPNNGSEPPHVLLLVRIDGDHINVITDTAPRPLEESLVQAGIPRQQITSPRRNDNDFAPKLCFPRVRLV